MTDDLFQPCGHCWVFQICWHIECSTFIASSFRIWNSAPGIPSPPLALFIEMLPKAQLISHSRMSAYRWVITPWWLSGLWRSFLDSSSVYPCHLFLISSVRSIPFLSFIVPIFPRNVPLVSLTFLKRSLVFAILLFSLFLALITEVGFLISPILWNYAFKWVYLSISPLPFASLLFSDIWRPPQTTILPCCISFSWGWSWSQPPVQCHEPPSVVLQALSIRSNPVNLFLTSTV